MSELSPVVLVGVGELGGVFARGLLRTGRAVVPVLRDDDRDALAAGLPDPELVLVTVGEGDLHTVLDGLPPPWMRRVGLVQNELLPRDWRAHGIDEPTVVCVWFEKKPGRDVVVVLSSAVFGPGSSLVLAALDAVGIPAHSVATEAAIRDELVRKNLYILVSNLGGLAVGGGTVGELWRDHHELASAIAAEILAIQEWLTGASLDGAELLAGMVAAFEADPGHQAMGRSAPARLARALHHADLAGVEVPTLRALAPPAS